MSQTIITRTATFVRQQLEGESTGHDWWHAERVWRNAQRIAASESVNQTVVELAALLHDVADPKVNDGDEEAGLQRVRDWLRELELPPSETDQVMSIISTMSFSKTVDGNHHALSLEAKVVQDADRLDALGAIGIARAFAYGGKDRREMYNPEVAPMLPRTAAEYKAARTTTINHFYDKLLLLKDRMNTATGQALAAERHQYMRDFLQQFYAETGEEPPC